MPSRTGGHVISANMSIQTAGWTWHPRQGMRLSFARQPATLLPARRYTSLECFIGNLPRNALEMTKLPPIPTPAGGLRTVLRALRHRNYRLFFGGQLISLIGTWMQTVAMLSLGALLNSFSPSVLPLPKSSAK